jgi:hypothetical protein
MLQISRSKKQRNKRREYLKDKINDLPTNRMSGTSETSMEEELNLRGVTN